MTPFGVVCQKCGAGMPAGVRFCGKCGTSIDLPGESAEEKTPLGKKLGVRTLLVGWGLGLLAGFMMGRALPVAPAPPPERQTDRNMESAESLIARAHEASDAKQFSRAVDLYHGALAFVPGDLSLLVDLGIAQAALGDDESARASFKAALTGRAPHPAGAYNLALLAEAKGNAALARAYYARYLALEPDGNGAARARAQLAEAGTPTGEAVAPSSPDREDP